MKRRLSLADKAIEKYGFERAPHSTGLIPRDF